MGLHIYRVTGVALSRNCLIRRYSGPWPMLGAKPGCRSNYSLFAVLHFGRFWPKASLVAPHMSAFRGKADMPQFEFSGTNSICPSAKSIGVSRPKYLNGHFGGLFVYFLHF